MNRRHWASVVLSILLLSKCALLEAQQKGLSEGIKDLATQIAKNVAKDQKRKIAVLPFKELDGRSTVLGTYLAEELVTDLFNAGDIEIVERTMLDKILGELKLNQTGVIDPETAKKVGRVAGVDAVVTGTITDLQSYIAVNCRLIDTQTGRIFAAAQTRIAKDADVKKIMGATLPGIGASGSEVRSPDKQTIERQPTKISTQHQEEEDFSFELKSCSLNGTSVRCEIVITNHGQDRGVLIYTGSGNSRMIDDIGDEHQMDETLELQLISGAPARRQIVFPKVNSEAKFAKVLLLTCLSKEQYRKFSVQFRDVPIARK